MIKQLRRSQILHDKSLRRNITAVTLFLNYCHSIHISIYSIRLNKISYIWPLYWTANGGKMEKVREFINCASYSAECGINICTWIVGGQWRHKITVYGNALSIYIHIMATSWRHKPPAFHVRILVASCLVAQLLITGGGIPDGSWYARAKSLT